jgi:nucleoside-diphosphate-sugar epimerase
VAIAVQLLHIKVARIFNTYGPRMHPNDGRVVSNFIVQALRGRDITVYGDGTQTRAFCYVDDLIDGLVRLMKSHDEVIGPINLGNPEEFTMLELAAAVIDLTGSRSKVVHRPRPTMFIDRHPPACITGRIPIPLAIISCAAPTRIECPESCVITT